MRRLLLSLTVACSVAVTAATGATATAMAGTLPVGQMQVALASNAVAPNFSWNSAATAAANATAARENVVILQPWETDELYALKAANPNITVLMYQNASSASDSASANGIYPSGVSYNQAAANGWLLKNTSGQTFTFNGENWLYAADIGNAAYQNAWAQNVVSELESAPWSGVFMDDVNPTISFHYTPSAVAEYPNDATYSAAMGSFVRNVGPQIQAAGKLAIANIGSWSSYASTVDPWLQSLSGAMDEEFAKWGTTAGSGYEWEGGWQEQLQEVSLCASENKLFLGVTHSSATDEQAADYGYASELLVANGDADFTMAPDYATQTWFPEYGYAIGSPTGSYTVTAAGVYERSFSNGLALVNPTSSPVTVNLGGMYSGSGLTSVGTVTMAPQSGLVLTPNAGTTVPSTGSGTTSDPTPTAPAQSSSTSGSATSTPTTAAATSAAPTSTSSEAATSSAASPVSGAIHRVHRGREHHSVRRNLDLRRPAARRAEARRHRRDAHKARARRR